VDHAEFSQAFPPEGKYIVAFKIVEKTLS
jgi:hypothetical protein